MPPDLSPFLTFEKETNILCGEEKKEVIYTIVSHQTRQVSSFLNVVLRGGKTMKIPVQCSFVMPLIETDTKVIDFGNIPVMGSNYQETLTVTNTFRNEVKLELSKKEEDNYDVEVRLLPRIREGDNVCFGDNLGTAPLKKKSLLMREEIREKKWK